MSKTIRFPTSARARKAYFELRDMGFGGEYAASVVDVLEKARSNLARWTVIRMHVLRDEKGARGWLKAQGYM